MNRLRLTDIRVPVARVLNVCSSSDDVRVRANEAHARLVSRGTWLGTRQRYRICVSSGCLVWPRQIETILAYWRCQTPGTIRNGWYEANIGGPGLMDSDSIQTSTLIDRDPVSTFDQPSGSASYIKVTADLTENTVTPPKILLRGYDQNRAWIRTEYPAASNTWIDGEWVNISAAGAYTTNYFTNITEVIKETTLGPVRLWEYDTDTASITKALAYYEPDETLPIYRASLVPGLDLIQGCCTGDTTAQVTVIAKLRHIDLVNENDFFLLGNPAAIKLMVMAILKEEKNLFEESSAYEAKAIHELQMELNSFEGDGALPTIKQESSETWGAGVLNPLTLGYRIY